MHILRNLVRNRCLGNVCIPRANLLTFKDLPKVGSKRANESASETGAKKPNRFADLYLKKSGGHAGGYQNLRPNRLYSQSDSAQGPRKNYNDQRFPSPQRNTNDNKEKLFLEYNRIRQKLNETHKIQQQQKNASGAQRNQTSKSNKGQYRPNKHSSHPVTEKIKITIPTFVTVANLATIMSVPLSRLLKKLEVLGFEGMTHNYILDKENASLVADEYGFDVTMSDDSADADLFPPPEKPEKLKSRPPVVTIMGHVDHGKTTILDYLRKSVIVQGEFGGITQHIGAFSVTTPISKRKITFLDTPGHAAFLSMRERGAIVTDIVILVVAADDSVMPQTIEAVKHAKKSGVPMIVAINKCDKPGIKVDKVLSDLARHGVDIEDYGGETQTVQVSGKTGLNMDKLEEAVITLSELSDFQAEYDSVPGVGWVIESEIVKGLGNVATVLVKRGTIKPGSFLVAGNTYCKVRGMKDEHGKPVKKAGPSTPVQIWGWKELPHSGLQILEAKLEQICKKVILNRESREKQIQAARDIDLINEKRQKEVKELERQEKINELKLAGLDASELLESEDDQSKVIKYIVKSDVFGSAEAIKESLDGLGNEEIRAQVISHEAGVPTESDLDMADALGAQILCFNVKVPKPILAKADNLSVKIHEQNVIYRLIEEVTAELTSKLKPHIEIKVLADIELRNVFNITGKNKTMTKVAGCKVNSGILKRSSKVRVVRKKDVIYSGTLSSLKHVKQDISEAAKGSECGLSFQNWEKFEEGDKIEAYEEIEIPRFL
ncbi:initiation factor 2 [Metschnikowia bicuspidata var. bicuspidata NRRL YB-4993]|uniref:Translation initiation factor IF-2, mitochondrial n=1 Tax=Metschnikowia bicuspidata var. bicuspidata NRRL YB-4993 TaxID=869754 RepID=A0A1A0H8E7_9ASCO|nr:initiation factor 2 [Metschnikowia bicuspidata var. bicuspidata NRRL YB-4993]OBA20163.1 initiation factor 2 [Metschnikowia bicuspidata var. bicuspidata NRRL YB-4993]